MTIFIQNGALNIPVDGVARVRGQDDSVSDVARHPELRAPLRELEVLRARLLLRRVARPRRPVAYNDSMKLVFCFAWQLFLSCLWRVALGQKK